LATGVGMGKKRSKNRKKKADKGTRSNSDRALKQKKKIVSSLLDEMEEGEDQLPFSDVAQNINVAIRIRFIVCPPMSTTKDLPIYPTAQH
jgi:hypothetical protein